MIEPGPFRTNFISEPLERRPAGATVRATRTAEAILAITDAANPPLRLAIDKVERTCGAHLLENET